MVLGEWESLLLPVASGQHCSQHRGVGVVALAETTAKAMGALVIHFHFTMDASVRTTERQTEAEAHCYSDNFIVQS